MAKVSWIKIETEMFNNVTLARKALEKPGWYAAWRMN